MFHLKMVAFKIINTLMLLECFRQTLPRKWLATSDTVMITISVCLYNRPNHSIKPYFKKNQYKAFIPFLHFKVSVPCLQEIKDISIVSILKCGNNQGFLSQMPLWRLTSDPTDCFVGCKKSDTIFPSVKRVMKSVAASDMFHC